MADNEESVVDNWEDADTEELERRMEERQKQLQTKKVIKIKTRPVADGPLDRSTSSGTSNTTVPSAAEPQTQPPLKIHDSDRTEYVAPIKILKRKAEGSHITQSPSTSQTSSPHIETAPTSTKQYKTLAEREAEYASARARILGTDYRSDDSPSISPTMHKATVTSSKGGSSTDNINRQPRGPNDSKGFIDMKTS